MFPHFLAQKFDQIRIHEFVIIGNKKADAAFRRQFCRIFLPQPFLVPLFHDHDDIRPADLSGGDFDAGGTFRAGGMDIPRRFILKMVSAVRLRRLLRLQMKRIFVCAPKFSSLTKINLKPETNLN
jgi:hypothetical protein